MSQAAERKRQLLTPPVVKPVITLAVIAICIFVVGDPSKGWAYNQWCAEHSITAQSFFSAVDKQAFADVFKMAFLATAAQFGPFAFVINSAFWWIFGSVVERKLLSWRYPAFLLIGTLGCWVILVYGVGFVEPAQRFIGPYMFMCYVLGAYLIFKPKKPFKPADWKPLPWKLFTGDEDHGIKKSVKVPFISPWVYITLFACWVGLLHFFFSMNSRDLLGMLPASGALGGAVKFLVGCLSGMQRWFVGSISVGTLQIMRPVQAAESCLLGLLSAYILMNIVFKSKLRRDAGDLQIQAILQYKELRALDMNHRQAVEGTAKLIGVPLDVAKDWIAKGLQTPPADN